MGASLPRTARLDLVQKLRITGYTTVEPISPSERDIRVFFWYRGMRYIARRASYWSDRLRPLMYGFVALPPELDRRPWVARIPHVSVTKSNPFDRLGNVLRMRRAVKTGDRAFDAAVHIDTSEPEAAVRGLLAPPAVRAQTLAILHRHGSATWLHFGEEDSVVAVTNRFVEVPLAPALLDVLAGIASQLPRPSKLTYPRQLAQSFHGTRRDWTRSRRRRVSAATDGLRAGSGWRGPSSALIEEGHGARLHRVRLQRSVEPARLAGCSEEVERFAGLPLASRKFSSVSLIENFVSGSGVSATWSRRPRRPRPPRRPRSRRCRRRRGAAAVPGEHRAPSPARRSGRDQTRPARVPIDWRWAEVYLRRDLACERRRLRGRPGPSRRAGRGRLLARRGQTR